jgi:hypothetical protein
MRQIVPHRKNLILQRSKIKMFLKKNRIAFRERFKPGIRSEAYRDSLHRAVRRKSEDAAIGAEKKRRPPCCHGGLSLGRKRPRRAYAADHAAPQQYPLAAH